MPRDGTPSGSWKPPGARPGTIVPPWLATLVRLLDDAIEVPGTSYRIGWDAILGFFLPGLGDAAAALSHVALLLEAHRAGVSRVIIGRMVLNAVIDAAGGALPFVGDVFDAAFKANRRNLELLERAERHPDRRVRSSDYLILFGAIGLVFAFMTAAFVLALLGALAVLRWLDG